MNRILRIILSTIMIIIAQTMYAQEVPLRGGLYWGMSYEKAIQLARDKDLDLDPEIIEGIDVIYLHDYHAFCGNIGLGKGYFTALSFNKNKKLYSVIVMLSQERFEELRKKGSLPDAFSFIQMTNYEWQGLRKLFGVEDLKGQDAVKGDFEQAILWYFPNGMAYFRREWKKRKKIITFNHIIEAKSETYEPRR